MLNGTDEGKEKKEDKEIMQIRIELRIEMSTKMTITNTEIKQVVDHT